MIFSLIVLFNVALELKAVFEKLQQAEQSGLSQEAIRKLEEQAAEQVSTSDYCIRNLTERSASVTGYANDLERCQTGGRVGHSRDL